MKATIRLLLPAVCLLASAHQTFAQTSFSWQFASNGLWSDPSFWTPTGVPASADSATVAAVGGNYTVTVAGATTVNALTVSSPNATVAGPGPLTLGTGSLTLSE